MGISELWLEENETDACQSACRHFIYGSKNNYRKEIPMPIITISRGSLSGDDQLANQLGARLGYKVISREVILDAVRDYGIAECELLDGMEKPPSFWQRLTHKKARYLLAIQAALAEEIQEGNVVYHGHAGHLLLAGLPNVLKLKLIAPMDFRVRNAMSANKMSENEATDYIRAIDEKRRNWVRLLYNVEWSDPSLYDMVINLEWMTMGSAVEMISDLVSHKEYRNQAAGSQRLKDFALETRIRARLAFKSDLHYDSIGITVQRGRINLEGEYFERHQEDVIEFVKNVEGVKEVDRKSVV